MQLLLSNSSSSTKGRWLVQIGFTVEQLCMSLQEGDISSQKTVKCRYNDVYEYAYIMYVHYDVYIGGCQNPVTVGDHLSNLLKGTLLQ